jgi:hypothetical protein
MERLTGDDIESEPFLRNEEQAVAFKELRCVSDRNLQSGRHAVSVRPCVVHILLISFYTMVYFVATHLDRCEFTLLHDTIRDLRVKVRTTEYVVAGLSPYAGGPTPEVDGAWHELLANISIRVSDEELARNGDRQESVRLPESGGQMAWLGVFHQLHCLVSRGVY